MHSSSDDLDSAVVCTAENLEIGRSLGKGGAGEVYEVNWRRNSEQGLFRCALKVLRSDFTHDQYSREKFLREFKLLRQIEHPNIVRSFGLAELGRGQHGVLLEIVEGENLRTLMMRGFPCGSDGSTETTLLPAIAQVGHQILTALRYAHEWHDPVSEKAQTIIHRDISPHNLMINPQGEIKILDFGIAKILGSDSTSTNTADRPGKPIYMAPEVLELRNFDERADLYSCGVVLLELIIGANIRQENLNLNDEANLLRLCPAYPLAWIQWLSRLLKTNPDDRFESAAHALKALEKLPEWINSDPSETLKLTHHAELTHTRTTPYSLLNKRNQAILNSSASIRKWVLSIGITLLVGSSFWIWREFHPLWKVTLRNQNSERTEFVTENRLTDSLQFAPLSASACNQIESALIGAALALVDSTYFFKSENFTQYWNQKSQKGYELLGLWKSLNLPMSQESLTRYYRACSKSIRSGPIQSAYLGLNEIFQKWIKQGPQNPTNSILVDYLSKAKSVYFTEELLKGLHSGELPVSEQEDSILNEWNLGKIRHLKNQELENFKHLPFFQILGTSTDAFDLERARVHTDFIFAAQVALDIFQTGTVMIPKRFTTLFVSESLLKPTQAELGSSTPRGLLKWMDAPTVKVSQKISFSEPLLCWGIREGEFYDTFGFDCVR